MVCHAYTTSKTLLAPAYRPLSANPRLSPPPVQLPINQQRKEAIRAKQALAATAAVQSEPPAMPVVTQEALAAALNRAFISRPQPEAAAGDVGGGGRADAPALRPHTSPEAAQRQPGYVQQFMQQRGMPQQQGGREAAAAAGLAGARAPASSPTAAAAAGMTTSAGGQASKLGTKLGRSGSPVFNLTASSGGGAFAQGEALQPLEDDEGALGDGVSGPLRPSKVTVSQGLVDIQGLIMIAGTDNRD